ncbi:MULTISPECIES: Ku protein [unclassified Rhodanobacter]|uniref:non-homologous end joining protein Ku n=1 Tax=unclassified Rhodanobacter TaxID=2621553 RepID=UPI001BDDCF1A|nr:MULTISPECIES: Ku protein [unclassified Rhodanobacter]MBT2142507.1 Ku protein [Rhodanobacter sp. LX-99]MBT2148420.1 Ku protein [Rhodanobacter sp. LX-100]
MARPIWTGTLSFGLLNVPVSLMSGERSVDLHFRMLDSRNNTPVRYERVNAETGEEVPWKEIVKAFEYAKGSYIVLEPEDIKSAASEGREVVDVKAFVDADSIGPEYFEKPYVLVPGKKAEKGYVLLRETLKRTGRIGIARVVIRTREYLSAVMPRGNALMLMLMRYPQELVDVEDYKIPEGTTSHYRISATEIRMAEQLIESMSDEWTPSDYRDEFRDRLRKVLEKRMKSKGVVSPEPENESGISENATTNVVDFMSLLQKSLASKRRTPAKKTPEKAVRKAAVRKKPTAASKKKKAPAKKTAKRAAARKTG